MAKSKCPFKLTDQIYAKASQWIVGFASTRHVLSASNHLQCSRLISWNHVPTVYFHNNYQCFASGTPRKNNVRQDYTRQLWNVGPSPHVPPQGQHSCMWVWRGRLTAEVVAADAFANMGQLTAQPQSVLQPEAQIKQLTWSCWVDASCSLNKGVCVRLGQGGISSISSYWMHVGPSEWAVAMVIPPRVPWPSAAGAEEWYLFPQCQTRTNLPRLSAAMCQTDSVRPFLKRSYVFINV